MINFDNVTKENLKEHNPIWLQIPDHLYRIFRIAGSGSGKTYLYAKDLCEAKCQFLSIKQEKLALTQFNNSKAFIEYSNDTDEI